jgi:hypothetical protein
MPWPLPCVCAHSAEWFGTLNFEPARFTEHQRTPRALTRLVCEILHGRRGPRDLGSGLRSSEKAVAQGKSGDHRPEHTRRPPSAIARNHQGIGQTVEHVKRRWPTVNEGALIDPASTGTHECRSESKVTILGRCAPPVPRWAARFISRYRLLNVDMS